MENLKVLNQLKRDKNMKNTTLITELKENNTSNLVLRWVENKIEEYDGTENEVLNKIINDGFKGLNSGDFIGMVSAEEITNYYYFNIQKISEIVFEYLDDLGLSMSEYLEHDDIQKEVSIDDEQCDGFARIMVKTALECCFGDLSLAIEDFNRR